MEPVKNKGGRPKGVKETKPRKTRKRALSTIASLTEEGYGLGETALTNLEMVDFLIQKAMGDIKLADELRGKAKAELDPKIYYEYLLSLIHI